MDAAATQVRGPLGAAGGRADVWRGRARVDELLHNVAARDEFIAVTSHELRTPLTALKLQLETMLAAIDRERVAADGRFGEKLAVALRQVERPATVVEAMLDASRIARRELALTPEDLDLADLARTVGARFEEEARATGSTIRVEGSAALGGGGIDRASNRS